MFSRPNVAPKKPIAIAKSQIVSWFLTIKNGKINIVDNANEIKIGSLRDRKYRERSENGILKIAGIKSAITSRSGISHFLNPKPSFAVTN